MKKIIISRLRALLKKDKQLYRIDEINFGNKQVCLLKNNGLVFCVNFSDVCFFYQERG